MVPSGVEKPVGGHRRGDIPSTKSIKDGKVFEGRAATGYDHGHDAEVFYLGLALDPRYVEGFIEGCFERIGDEDPDGEMFLRDLWGDEGERETVLEALQVDCEVRPGRPPGY